jgi:hypothetical protein
MSWILLVFLHAGAFSHNDDVSITTARFYNQNACVAAGRDLSELAKGTVQDVKFTCIHDADGGH